MRHRKKILIAICGVIIMGLPIFTLATTFPKTAGTVSVAGLGETVTITRDDRGIPHIHAQTMDDGAFGLGFTHAQDRFFQMEMMRRLGAGRLSELVGDKALASDRHMRTLGLFRLAKQQVAAASPALRRRLDFYAAGVNAWLNQATWPRTVEFIAFPWFRPELWQPADSLIWGKLMAMRLANNWRAEHLRLRMAARLTPGQIDFLWPTESSGPPILAISPRLTSIRPPALPDLSWDPRSVGGLSSASNAWIVGGGKSGSASTVLANDPHLEFRAPILWYLATIKTSHGLLAGATVPGVPFMIIGHNSHVAWGFTTTGADTEDLILERSTDQGRHYDTPTGPSPFVIREDTVDVGGEKRRLRVYETPDGPVIAGAGTNVTMTLNAPYLQPGDRTPEALMALNQAKSVADVDAALAQFHAPVQNVFYVTKDGHAGFRVAGRIPIRHRGNGQTPLTRADGPVGHRDYIPYSELPSAEINENSRVVLNANNRVTGPNYGHLLTSNWPAPYRAERLAHLLSQPLGDPAIPQRDIKSPAALALLKAAWSQLDAHQRQIPEAAALAGWDGRMDRKTRTPLLFHLWATSLKRRLFADELGDFFRDWHGIRNRSMVSALTSNPEWCDDISTDEVAETCAGAIFGAFDDARFRLEALDDELGRPAVWGDVHVATFDHPLFAQVPGLAALTGLKIATDGGHYTLNRGAMHLGRRDNPFAHRHGAGLRAVFDTGNLEKSRFMIATGQSGNPLSVHYDDQLEAWRDGKFLTLVPTHGISELKLLPLQP